MRKDNLKMLVSIFLEKCKELNLDYYYIVDFLTTAIFVSQIENDNEKV